MLVIFFWYEPKQKIIRLVWFTSGKSRFVWCSHWSDQKTKLVTNKLNEMVWSVLKQTHTFGMGSVLFSGAHQDMRSRKPVHVHAATR